jgi:predicted GTPase
MYDFMHADHHYNELRKKRLILLLNESADHLLQTASQLGNDLLGLTYYIQHNVFIDRTASDWKETLLNALPEQGVRSALTTESTTRFHRFFKVLVYFIIIVCLLLLFLLHHSVLEV